MTDDGVIRHEEVAGDGFKYGGWPCHRESMAS